MVHWYVSTRSFSHWSIWSSQTTYHRAPQEPLEDHSSCGHSGSAWPPLCHIASSFFSLHITERLNFYKSYTHKTFFLSLSWWEIRRVHTPGLPRVENSIWEMNWLSWRLVPEHTLLWNSGGRGRFQGKVKRKLPIASGSFLFERGPDQSQVPLLWLFVN